MDNHRIGVVLEGGGTKGAYHAGALLALQEAGIRISAITGTSIGAINGAAFISGKLDQMIEIYDDFDPEEVFFGSKEVAAAFSFNTLRDIEFSTITAALSAVLRNRGVDISPLLHLLESNIDENVVRHSPIDFGLVSFNLSQMKVIEVFKEEIPEGKLIEYILASAALPGFILPSETKYLDGGVYKQVPLDLLLEKGPFDVIYVVRTRRDYWTNLEREGERIEVIVPSRSMGTVLQSGHEHVRENLMMGYYDALRLLRGYQGKLYCIEKSDDESFYRRFVHIPQERLGSVNELFGEDSRSCRRAFFEDTIPLLASILGLKEDGGYQEIGIEWMERVAFDLDIPRYCIYKEEELFELVQDALKERKDEDLKSLGRLEATIARLTGLSRTEQSALLRRAWQLAMGG
ncbi:MAG: patatin-like phospholipase family protein [Tissierellia bacterium]|nr:patatin-like phospholipase family protein [Bacillota bacterium]NLL23014.1 patatin-like phospholipase family protein [Tissierellia bacterium]